MKTKLYLLPLLMLLIGAVCCPKAWAYGNDDGYLEGAIGPYPVQVDISPEKNGPITGRYRYIRNGRPGKWFRLSGKVTGWKSTDSRRGDTGFMNFEDRCRITLTETSPGGAVTGKWDVAYESSNAPMGLVVTLEGVFLNTKTQKKFKIDCTYMP